jgi:hypothetical protein
LSRRKIEGLVCDPSNIICALPCYSIHG